MRYDLDREYLRRQLGAGLHTGHGHIRPHPDGTKARCGGPALCEQCAGELDQVLMEALAPMLTTLLEGVGGGLIDYQNEPRRRRLVRIASRALAELDADDLDDVGLVRLEQAVGPLHQRALVYLARLEEVMGEMRFDTGPGNETTVAAQFAQLFESARVSVQAHWRYLLYDMMNRPARELRKAREVRKA